MAAAAKKTVKTMKAADLFVRCLETEGVERIFGIREVEGDVLPDTEIFINGKLSTLNDIKIGERAVIQGRIEKTANSTRITALKIDITRDESVTFDTNQMPGGR